MGDDSLEHLPLRDQFTETEQILREIIEHVERGFLPKVQALNRLAKKDHRVAGSGGRDDPNRLKDVTVRHHASEVLNSEDFADKLCGRADKHLMGIDENLSRIIEGE